MWHEDACSPAAAAAAAGGGNVCMYVAYVLYSECHNRVRHWRQSVLLTTSTCTLSETRGGSPTSCLLFICIFMDELIIRMIFKQRCLPDGFLGWLHILVYTY